MGDSKSLSVLGAYAISLVTLAAIDLTGIAVVREYKASGLVDNDTADDFVAGLTIFGAFVGVLAISVIGKAVIGLFKKGM